MVLELSHVAERIAAWMLEDDPAKSVKDVGIEGCQKDPPVFGKQVPDPATLVASGRVSVWNVGAADTDVSCVDRMFLCLVTCVVAMLITGGARTYRAEHNGRVGEFSVTERLSDFMAEHIPFALSSRVGLALTTVIFDSTRPKPSRGWFAPSPEQKGADLQKLCAFIAENFPEGSGLISEMSSETS